MVFSIARCLIRRLATTHIEYDRPIVGKWLMNQDVPAQAEVHIYRTSLKGLFWNWAKKRQSLLCFVSWLVNVSRIMESRCRHTKVRQGHRRSHMYVLACLLWWWTWESILLTGSALVAKSAQNMPAIKWLIWQPYKTARKLITDSCDKLALSYYTLMAQNISSDLWMYVCTNVWVCVCVCVCVYSC